MNGIAKKTNSLIVKKACYLLFNSNFNQFFWIKAFNTAVYFLNWILSASLVYNILLEEFFKA